VNFAAEASAGLGASRRGGLPDRCLKRAESLRLRADSNQQPETLFNHGARSGFAVTLAQPDFG